MADWQTVREIAGALPGAEASTTYGQPAFKVGGKLFAEHIDRRQLEERIEDSWLLRAPKRLAYIAGHT